MRRNIAFTATLAAVFALFSAVSTDAKVRFELRASVAGVCRIEQQTAWRDGAAATVDVEVACNMSAFTLGAPGARAVTLEDYRLLGAVAPEPVIFDTGTNIGFADLAPGRHLIRLRIAGPAGATRLVLDAH